MSIESLGTHFCYFIYLFFYQNKTISLMKMPRKIPSAICPGVRIHQFPLLGCFKPRETEGVLSLVYLQSLFLSTGPTWHVAYFVLNIDILEINGVCNRCVKWLDDEYTTSHHLPRLWLYIRHQCQLSFERIFVLKAFSFTCHMEI